MIETQAETVRRFIADLRAEQCGECGDYTTDLYGSAGHQMCGHCLDELEERFGGQGAEL